MPLWHDRMKVGWKDAAPGRPRLAVHGPFNSSNVDLCHLHHRGEHTLGHGRDREREALKEDRWRNLPRHAQPVLAPATGTSLPAVVDDGMPIAIRLLLIAGRNLKGKGLAVPEFRPAIEPEAGDAHQGELNEQHVALFAGGEIPRCAPNGIHG